MAAGQILAHTVDDRIGLRREIPIQGIDPRKGQRDIDPVGFAEGGLTGDGA
jgi:hypothetical protein